MQTLYDSKRRSKHGLTRRMPTLRAAILSSVLLLSVALFASFIPLARPAHAADSGKIRNADFESGSLSPWTKWPSSAPGIVAVENCCGNHTPGGTWNAYIQPQGQHVAMYQTVSVTAGQIYYLQAWVSTNGMTANLDWWSNAGGGIQRNCGSTNAVWPTYALISCQFTVPAGTTSFNVQLNGNAPTGKWAVTDDWTMDFVRNNFVVTELRADQSAVNTSKDYIQYIYVGSKPSTSGGFTNGWIGINLDNKPGLYGLKFTQVGFQTTVDGPIWFVYSEATVTCLRGSAAWGNFGCKGAINDKVALGQWQQAELVNYGQGFWIARVYDKNGVPSDVAKIWSSNTRIHYAQVTTEEGIETSNETDPVLKADFSFWHPRYMVWGSGFQEWPASSGGINNKLWTWPNGVCPAKYGATLRLNSDPRFWHAGSGDTTCSANPMF